MTVDQQKMIFGFSVLLVLAVLGGLTALGDVKAETSFGLEQILGGLLVMAGGFAHWAFQGTKTSTSKDLDA